MPKSTKKPDVINIILMIGIGVVILGLVAWAATRSKPQSAPEAATAQPPVAEVPAPMISQDELDRAALETIPRIAVDELQKELAAGTAVVIDVRDQQAFIAGHIPNALQIPVSFVQGEIPYFPRDKKIVAYCT